MLDIVFVGTGDAFGSGGRRNSAILVRNAQHTLLLDCGPTTLLGLKDLGVDPCEIDAIAISHFHGDHAAGVPFMLIEYLYENRREKPLEIFGPPGIRERIEALTQAFGYQSELERAYELDYHEFDCTRTHEGAGFAIRPYPAHHHPETRPHMLRVEMGDRAICFSGDTGWTDTLPGTVGDVCLFITECTMMEESFEYHLSHERLTLERKRFCCDRMLLTHLGRQVLAESGRVHFDAAEDGLRVSV